MEYYFKYGFIGARTMVIKLNADELEDVWADSEEGRAVYGDLTIEFEIDRYLRLRNVLAKLEQETAQGHGRQKNRFSGTLPRESLWVGVPSEPVLCS